jgi:hypothetical protein
MKNLSTTGCYLSPVPSPSMGLSEPISPHSPPGLTGFGCNSAPGAAQQPYSAKAVFDIDAASGVDYIRNAVSLITTKSN